MTYSSFSHNVEEYVQPSWKKLSTSLSKVQAADSPEFDAQALQEDGKEVGHQDNEEKSEAIGSSGGHIRRVISGIDVGN